MKCNSTFQLLTLGLDFNPPSPCVNRCYFFPFLKASLTEGDFTWHRVELASTTEDCLKRAHFGAFLQDDQIFFFGGCRKIESGEFVNLPISQLYCINLETKTSQFFILSMPSPYQVNIT